MQSLSVLIVRWLAAATVLIGTLSARALAQAPEFIRGDVNRDGQVTLSDVSYLFDFRYLGGAGPGCMDAADTDDNGAFDTLGTADMEFLLSWLFRSPTVPSLPPPFPKPGIDPTADGLNCAQPGFDPPGRPLRGFDMELRGGRAVARGARAEFFLHATTAQEIECVSIAYRVERTVAQRVSVDLDGTIFPTALQSSFEASPAFRFAVVPSADRRYDLLIAGAIFVTQETVGLRGIGGPGAPYRRIQFPATQGPLKAAKLLRVTFDVPRDAPRGDIAVFLPPEDDDLLVAGSFVHGVKNEYGVIDPDHPGSNTYTTPIPTSVIVDGEEYLRGDANSDSVVNISDAQHTLAFLFIGGPAPSCMDRADANDDGVLNISDPSFTLGFLFLGTAAPPSPGPFLCGYDEKGDNFDPCLDKFCP